MKKSFSFLFLCLLLGACQQPAQDQGHQTAVRIGQEIITENDVQERLRFLPEEDREFAQTTIGRQNFLQIIAREKLIAAAAKEAGMHESDIYLTLLEDKRAQLEEIYNDFANQTLEQLWYDSLKENGTLNVSAEEIENYYDKYPYEMTVSQIIIDNAETAEQVLRTLKGSPRRWKEMERQYSTAPEIIRGDNFSFMPGEFLPEIEVIAANSASGSVQGFIKTPLGFHIIMKMGEKRLSRKEAEPRIRKVLENKKLDEVLENLKKKYEVIIYEKAE
jgi:parvulin-like peptidyl-prolyl isomerase